MTDHKRMLYDIGETPPIGKLLLFGLQMMLSVFVATVLIAQICGVATSGALFGAGLATFAYLFGIDLERREMVWLNAGRSSGQNIAGESSLAFLIPSFHVTEVINLYSFFELMATELVEDPREAELIVSDRLDALDADAERIHSYDFDRILALMNR